MSLSRIFRWSCDFCTATHEQTGYGLPKGWVVLAADVLIGVPTQHACPLCRSTAWERRTDPLPQYPMNKSDWKPIESAPKDGTAILIYVPRGIAHVRWNKCAGSRIGKASWTGAWETCWNNSDGWDDPNFDNATHWQPLPEPPCD